MAIIKECPACEKPITGIIRVPDICEISSNILYLMEMEKESNNIIEELKRERDSAKEMETYLRSEFGQNDNQQEQPENIEEVEHVHIEAPPLSFKKSKKLPSIKARYKAPEYSGEEILRSWTDAKHAKRMHEGKPMSKGLSIPYYQPERNREVQMEDDDELKFIESTFGNMMNDNNLGGGGGG